jgi:hypothetical protein
LAENLATNPARQGFALDAGTLMQATVVDGKLGISMTGTKYEGTLTEGTDGEITVRRCSGIEGMKACVALQKDVRNFSDAELVPLPLFVLGEQIGGQVIGAFLREDLSGLAMAVPGIRSHRPFLQSYMLAVPAHIEGAMKWLASI